MAEESAEGSGAAAAARLPSADGAGGENIAKILKATGPVIKCVLLKHMRTSGKDVKPHVSMRKAEAKAVTEELHLPDEKEKTKTASPASSPSKKEEQGGSSASPPPSPRVNIANHAREVLTELIEEIEMDTTPSKKGAQGILGGPFTFVGQYPDQELVLMARADQIEDLTSIETLSVKELISLCKDSPDIDYNHKTMLEKSDLVAAVRDAQLPVNPHKLQPPLNDVIVRGDILVIKVAKDDDDEDDETAAADEETATAQAIADFTKMSAVSNEEFFLNYSKDEWIEFASRTDIVAPKMDTPSSGEEDEEQEAESEEEENAAEGDHDEEDEDYNVAEDDDVPNDEDERHGILNLILGEVLKKFREENGRGPDTEELLELRRQVASKLGLELDESTAVVNNDHDKKRSADTSSTPSPKTSKRVKFTPDVNLTPRPRVANQDDDDGEGEKKPEATA